MSGSLVAIRLESKSPRCAYVTISLDLVGKEVHVLLPLSAVHITVEDASGKQLVDCWRARRRQDAIVVEIHRLIVSSGATIDVSFASEFFVSNANGSLTACLHFPFCSQFSEAVSALRSNIIWDGKKMKGKVEPSTNIFVVDLQRSNATSGFSNHYWLLVPTFFTFVIIATLIAAFLM